MSKDILCKLHNIIDDEEDEIFKLEFKIKKHRIRISKTKRDIERIIQVSNEMVVKEV